MASVYQKKALRRLESPEQLDKLIVVTSPMTWLIMVGASLIVLAFLAWAFWGSITRSITVDATVTGDDKGAVMALVPIDDAMEIKPGQSCLMSVVLGDHSGMELNGTVLRQELVNDGSIPAGLMIDEAMAAVYILPDPGVSLNKGELLSARIVISDAHPYSFLSFGKTQ